MLRNGPNTILRSHSATNEGLHQPQAPMGNLLGTYSRGPPRRTQTGSSNQPPLIPVAGDGPTLSQPLELDASYFSPVTEEPMGPRARPGWYPFPQLLPPDDYNISHYSILRPERDQPRETAPLLLQSRQPKLNLRSTRQATGYKSLHYLARHRRIRYG